MINQYGESLYPLSKAANSNSRHNCDKNLPMGNFQPVRYCPGDWPVQRLNASLKLLRPE